MVVEDNQTDLLWAEAPAEIDVRADNPVWLGAYEEFHASPARPLPILGDVLFVSAALAVTGISSTAVLAGPLFVCLGLATGFFRRRRPPQPQGVARCMRGLVAPA